MTINEPFDYNDHNEFFYDDHNECFMVCYGQTYFFECDISEFSSDNHKECFYGLLWSVLGGD